MFYMKILFEKNGTNMWLTRICEAYSCLILGFKIFLGFKILDSSFLLAIDGLVKHMIEAQTYRAYMG